MARVPWGYIGGMPKVSIYLPDDLYAEVREQGIPMSSVAQRALEDALRAGKNAAWIARAAQRPLRTARVIDTAALLDEVREEFGA